MSSKLSHLLPEYAGKGPAIIEPSKTRPKGIKIPSRVVLCFFDDILRILARQKNVKVLHNLKSEMGKHPILGLSHGNRMIGILNPGVGAPLAAGLFEEVIALGARSVIVCGGAGVLDPSLDPGTVIIPTRAVRDEGTSYHYQPRSRTNRPHRDAVNAIKKVCRRHGTHFVTGATWTTDAFYRETSRKIASRRKEGCLTVEMEAAALFAVARFRRVRLAQLLYAGDDVSGNKWNSRRWAGRPSAREKLLMLAIESVKSM